MQYVITRRDGPWEGRVKPVALLGQGSQWFQGEDAFHIDSYLRLLARQVETILAPFGYREDQLYAWLKGDRRNLVMNQF